MKLFTWLLYSSSFVPVLWPLLLIVCWSLLIPAASTCWIQPQGLDLWPLFSLSVSLLSILPSLGMSYTLFIYLFNSQAIVYYSKGIKSRINKGKRYIRQKLEDTRYKLPRVLSQCSHTGHTKSPSNELEKHMQNVFCQGSLLEPKSPGFLLG